MVPRTLRADLLAAATALIERTGSAEAVSLRAVAREAGVTAPAVYGHFADLGALLDAVIAQGFTDLGAAIAAATDAVADPVRSTRAVAAASRSARRVRGTMSLYMR